MQLKAVARRIQPQPSKFPSINRGMPYRMLGTYVTGLRKAWWAYRRAPFQKREWVATSPPPAPPPGDAHATRSKRGSSGACDGKAGARTDGRRGVGVGLASGGGVWPAAVGGGELSQGGVGAVSS